MRAFAQAYLLQLRQLAQTRKLRLLLLIFAGACALTGAIYRERVVRELPVAVVDFDGSRISRTIRLFLEATPELRVVDSAPTSVAEAEEQLVDGRLAGLVVLPSSLSVDLKHGRRAQVLVGVDMSNILVGRTAYRAIAKVVTTAAAGVELSYLTKTGVPGQKAMAQVLPVATDDRLSFNPAASYAVYMAPTFTFFFLNLLFMVLAGLAFLPPEAAKTPWELAGRLAAVWTVGMAAGLALGFGLLPFEGLSNQSGAGLLVLSLATFLAVDVLLVLAIQAVVPSPTLAFQASLLLGVLALMLSGATFPVDAFPAFFQRVSGALPFTAFSRGLRLFFNQPTSLSDLALMFRDLGLQAATYAGAALVGWAARLSAAALARRPA